MKKIGFVLIFMLMLLSSRAQTYKFRISNISTTEDVKEITDILEDIFDKRPLFNNQTFMFSVDSEVKIDSIKFAQKMNQYPYILELFETLPTYFNLEK